MAGTYIRTIEDLERATYFGSSADEVMSMGIEGIIQKSDAPILTSTTGVYNAIYGARLWTQANKEANVFGLVPKRPWDKTGFRMETSASSSTASDISIAQGGLIPDTTKGTYLEIAPTPKVEIKSFDMSDVQIALQGRDDVITWADFREAEGRTFANLLNRQLCTAGTNLASNMLESVDRATGSYDEVTNCSDITAGDLDIYGNDRDAAATAFDAYVNHLSNVDRTLQLKLIDNTLEQIYPYWTGPSGLYENKVMITGWDTYNRINQLYAGLQRFGDFSKGVRASVNGIQTLKGQEGGMTVSTHNQIPIVPSANVPQDTLSRIWILNLDFMWLSTIRPISYMESSNFQLLGKMTREGVWLYEGELVTTMFRAQGKVRDLK